MKPTGSHGGPPGEEPSLGSDPFSSGDGTLPYLIRLRERNLRLVPAESSEAPELGEPAHPPERRKPIDLGPPVPEVGRPVNRRPTEVDAHLARLAEGQFADLAGGGVIQVQHDRSS